MNWELNRGQSPWPDFVDDESRKRKSYDEDPEFAKVERMIVEEYGRDKLTMA